MVNAAALPRRTAPPGDGLLFRLARAKWRLLATSALAGIAWQVIVLLVPVTLGWAIDDGVERRALSTAWLAGGAILLLGLGEAVADGLRHRAENTVSAEIAAELREHVLAAALRFSEEDRERFPSGEVIGRLTSDADEVADLFDAFGYTVAYALAIPVVLIILFVIDPLLCGALFALSVGSSLVIWRTSGAWQRRSLAVQEAVGETLSRAQETLEGFKAIRGIGAEAAVLDRFDRESLRIRDAARSTSRLYLWFGPLLDVLAVLPVGLVLWVAGDGVAGGRLSLGQAVAAIGLGIFLIEPVRAVGHRVFATQSALASLNRIRELPHLFAEPDTGHDAGHEAVPALLELDNVAFAFATRPDAPIFEALTLRFIPGEVVHLRGAVGSGKSTLLRVMAGHRPPASGEVRLAGLPLAAWDARARHRHILLLDHAPFILSGSIAGNLRLGRPEATTAEMRDALALAGATDFVDVAAGGLEHEAGERGARLSGGQRQRLALARATLARPDVLLLDGATGGLEPAREAAVLRRVVEQWRHGVVVVVSTNPLVEALATRTVDLGTGREDRP